MKIRTRVRISGALTVSVLLAYGVLILYLDRSMSNLAHDAKDANQMVMKIGMLRNLTQDYLLHRSERAQKQWLAAYAEVLQFLDHVDPLLSRIVTKIGDPAQKMKNVGDAFSRLMAVQQSAGPLPPGEGTQDELQGRLTTQLLLATYDLMTGFANLNEEINDNLIATQRLISFLDILALTLLGLMLFSNAFFLQRAVVQPILKLHEGVEIIGGGNLDHKVGMTAGDEIGQLSRAFDQMTGNLKRLTASLQKSEEDLRSLASRLLRVQEEERACLAYELHDDLGQALLVLRMQLNAALKRWPPEQELRQNLEDAASYLLEIINKVRHLSRNLSPSTLESFGLSVALKNLCEEFQKYHAQDQGLVINFDLDEVKDILPREANIVIFRIAQEFLANVHKHAQATSVNMAIKALPDKVTFTLEDNGKGFDLDEVRNGPTVPSGLGLISMEERVRLLGGQLFLTSEVGKGTRLYFELPRIPPKEAPGQSLST